MPDGVGPVLEPASVLLTHPGSSPLSLCRYKADNGWWVGINTRTQRNGIFPGTYVEEM